MKKMTDGELDELVSVFKDCDCGDFWIASKHIRAFYDAQIDAQAKTMEQIALSQLRYYDVDMNKINKFMHDYKIDLDRDMEDIFKAKIEGFLAAGGVIKQ
jgi:hypothetical protein